mmetsp:Transcript_51148/g.102199  ORF Transcript_51148/g.102199 Transcript_51148/m.102199 type:complete len:515 (-) Transcript_51148:322-1866(-)
MPTYWSNAAKHPEFELPLVGAIDEGTQSCRFLVFDKAGTIVVSHQKQKKQYYPQAGWCEQDPKEIVENIEHCVTEACTELLHLGFATSDIAAVGIANQRETIVVWDRETGEPLHNAIVWLDTRTSSVCEQLSEAHGGRDAFKDKCGLPISTYFSGVKLKWILDNVEGVREKAEKGEALFGTVDSWLLYRFTGRHVTDSTNACRTMLMNIETLLWDADVCKAFGIPMAMLPEIRSSAEVYGKFQDTALKGVPIAACLGDQQAALIGHGGLSKGDAKNTYGSGCFLILNTDTECVRSKHGLLTTVAYKFGDEPAKYALEGSVAIAGVGISWLKDNLKIIDDVKQSTAIAESVPDTGGVYLVPAFSGLFAPHWREDARGVIVGLTQYTTSAHIVRAMLESIAFQANDVAEAMVLDAGLKVQDMKVDGGVTANDFFVRFQSDVMETTVKRPAMIEITALGAAMAAGLAVGVWKSVDEAQHMQESACTYEAFVPAMEEEEVARRKQRWNDAISRTLNWA